MNDDQHTYVEPTATALHERDHDRAEETPRESEASALARHRDPSLAKDSTAKDAATSVKGHWFLPGGGHETCPVAVTRSARWWPWDLPLGGCWPSTSVEACG